MPSSLFYVTAPDGNGAGRGEPTIAGAVVHGAKIQDTTSTPYAGAAPWCMVLTDLGATFMAARGSCLILRPVFVLGVLGMTAGTKLLVTPSMREKIDLFPNAGHDSLCKRCGFCQG